MKLFLNVVFLCVLTNAAHPQDSTTIDLLIKRIAAQQVSRDAFFMPGIFPSYVARHDRFNDQKKDNNIFYNALTGYTLNGLKQYLLPRQLAVINQIDSAARPLYTKFKNTKGRDTYNFWRKDSSFQFPYTNWIHKVRKSVTLPDDLDDTVLSLMAMDAPDSVAATVHALMQHYVNQVDRPTKTALKRYKKFAAYSTWFGKDFPVVFDISVLSNVLSFVQHYGLAWTNADSASLHLIVTAINNNDYLHHGLYVSPYYAKPSVILYHLARLMSIKNMDTLEALKPKLVTDAINEFAKTDNILEKMILCSAIMKWGYQPPALIIPQTLMVPDVIEQNELPFFIGNMPSYFPMFYKRVLMGVKWGLYYHYCPAYNDALFLEYLLLKQHLNH